MRSRGCVAGICPQRRPHGCRQTPKLLAHACGPGRGSTPVSMPNDRLFSWWNGSLIWIFFHRIYSANTVWYFQGWELVVRISLLCVPPVLPLHGSGWQSHALWLPIGFGQWEASLCPMRSEDAGQQGQGYIPASFIAELLLDAFVFSLSLSKQMTLQDPCSPGFGNAPFPSPSLPTGGSAWCPPSPRLLYFPRLSLDTTLQFAYQLPSMFYFEWAICFLLGIWWEWLTYLFSFYLLSLFPSHLYCVFILTLYN